MTDSTTGKTGGEGVEAQADAGPMLARSASDGELRQQCPRDTLNMLDAISMSRQVSRTYLVNEILGKWADERRHETILICRVAGFNPTESESVGARA